MAINDLIIAFGEGQEIEGWPGPSDLAGERSSVFVDPSLVDPARRILLRNRLCLIRGPEGRGKTVLARIVCNQLMIEGWQVRIIDFALIQESADVDQVIENMKTFGWKTFGWKQKKSLIIVENVHRAEAEVIRKLLRFQWDVDFQASLLFTRRWIAGMSDDVLDDPLGHLISNHWHVDLNPNIDTAEQIVSKASPAYRIDEADRTWIRTICGNSPNLRRLRWYLGAWLKSSGRRLAEVGRQEVYNDINLDLTQRKSVEYRNVLVFVSAILQLDVAFDSRVLTEGEREAMSHERQISGRIFYRMAHASDGALILEASASRLGVSVADLTANSIRRYVELGPANYVQLLLVLLEHQVPKIRRSVRLQDASKLLDRALEDPISSIAQIITYLHDTRGNDAAERIWVEYEAKLSESEGSARTALMMKIETSSIRGLLRLAKISEDAVPGLRRTLESICTADALFARVNQNTLGDIASILRDTFLRRALFPPQAAATALARSVAGLPLRAVFSFLNNLGSAIDDSFITDFASALVREPKFLKGMDSYAYSSIKELRSYKIKINPELAKHFNKFVSEELEAQAMGRASLLDINSTVVGWRGKKKLTDMVDPKTREDRVAGSVLRYLSLDDHLKQKAEKSSKPFAKMGTFCSILALVHTDPVVSEGILKQVAAVLEFKPLRCDPGQLLSLLVTLRRVNEGLWRITATRAAREYDVAGIARRLDPVGGSLLWHILQIDAASAALMTKEYFSVNPCTILSRWRNGSSEHRFTHLLSNLSVIDPGATQNWVRRESADQWLLEIGDRTPDATVPLVALIYLVDAEFAKTILNGLTAKRFALGMAVSTYELPLLGLYTYIFKDFKCQVLYPKAEDVVRWLSKEHPFTAWAFAWYSTRIHFPQFASKGDGRATRRRLKRNKRFRVTISEGIQSTFHPGLRSALVGMLRAVSQSRNQGRKDIGSH